MQCVKATFINFLLKPKQLFGLPQVFKLSPPRALLAQFENLGELVKMAIFDA